MEIKQGENQISEIFVGNMGIKTIFVGNEPVYERTGGYIYIELNTKGDDK